MRTVYIVRSAEEDFRHQILGVFKDQYAAWDCERWYHSIGVGSIRIDEEYLQDKFEEP